MNRETAELEVEKLGYTSMSVSGSTVNCICNGNGLHLSVTYGDEITATISAFHKLVECKLGPFSFPHKFFSKFETQVMECHPYFKDNII